MAFSTQPRARHQAISNARWRAIVTKVYGAAGHPFALRLLESAANREAARLARVRFSASKGIYLDVLEAEWSDFASRRALAVARPHKRLTVVSIYKLLGGG